MKTPAAFLSHSGNDASAAERLARDLRKQGVDVWYAEWEIKPGQSLRRKIDEGIDRATHFLVLLTPASLKSEWVQTELDAALVKRISGACRLIPILLGIGADEVPATLRGLKWVQSEPYEEGLRHLLEACHDVSTKPPLGRPPAWASERPLQASGLSVNAQRLAAWINERSADGTRYEIYERDTLMSELELTAQQIGMAASELSDAGYVKLVIDGGSGEAGFSHLRPEPPLFFDTDSPLRGWDPRKDAVELAAAMVNTARGGQVSLANLAEHLGWPPRRLNPAADFLSLHGYVQASEECGSAPYTYGYAFLTHRTRRLAEDGR